MSELNYIADKLEEMRRDIGVSNYAGFLEKAQEGVMQVAADKRCHMDIHYHTSSLPSIRKEIEKLKLQETDPACSFHFITDRKEPLRLFLQMIPSIAVVFLDEDFLNDPQSLSFYNTRSTHYKIVFVCDFFEDETTRQNFISQVSRGIKTEIFPSAELIITPLLALINERTGAETLARLGAFSRHNTIKPIIPLLQDIFHTENKVIQTRKLLSNQDGQIIRKEEQQQNSSDFINQLKQLVQKNMSEMEKNYRSKYEELNKPNTGKFSQIAIECSRQVKDFHREDIAEKSEKVSITLNKEVTDQVLQNVGKSLKEEFKKDETFINSIFDELVAKINNQLTEKGIAPLRSQDLYIPFPEAQRMLNSYCYINKPYAGELVKKGVSEYFIALRDYTGLIMVAAGLLAPLNMVASISENAVLKNMSNGIRITTGAITLIMIVYGIYDLRRRIPRKRLEEFDRELGRAREVINQESKRIFNESSRDWQTGISNWIRDVGQNILSQIEANSRATGLQRVQQLNAERAQQQRSQQSVDTLQRNLGYAEKTKDALISKMKETLGNIEKEIKL